MRIEGVIIAAGKSSRMGANPKLTLDLQGQSLIERSLCSMLPFCAKIVVVTGFHQEKIVARLRHYPNLDLVNNENCAEGMFSSLKAGLSRVQGERIFFLPGDCPFVEAGVYQKMLQAEADIVIPAYAGQPGHPVLLSGKAAREVLENKQYHTLKEYIDANRPAVIEVDCPGVLWDIDTPKDYAAAQKYARTYFKCEIISIAHPRRRGDEMEMKNISKPIRRFDFDAKIEGEIQYCADLHPEGMLYARTFRSAMPRAKILDLAVPELPKGYVIVDYRDIPGKNVVPIVYEDQPFFAENAVNYIGEPILLVVGPDKEVLLEILERIEVTYDPVPAVFSIEEAAAQQDHFIFGDKPYFVGYAYTKGDPEKAIQQAVSVIEDEFRTGYQEQVYLETQSVLSEYKDGCVTVYGSIQCPYYIHDALKMALGWDEKRIRVVQLPTGGAFGGKEDYPSILGVHAALAAIKTGKPVQLVLDRHEDLLATTKRHPSLITIKSFLDVENRIIAREMEVKLDAGAYAGLSSVVLQRTVFSGCGVYNIENLRVTGKAYATNNVVSGAFRGFGGPQAFFAIEMHMENIAAQLNIDPLELKRQYFIKQGDTSSTGGRFHNAVKLGEIAAAIDKNSGYSAKRRQFKQLAQQSAGLKGIGCSIFFHGCGFTGAGEAEVLQSKIRLKKYRDNTVEIFVSSTEMGQGVLTTLRKIVAQALDLPLDQVRHNYPDTAECPDSGPTVASRTILIIGRLLQECAKDMKQRWNEAAEFEILRTYTYPADLAWDNDRLQGDAYIDYSWGANAVEVEIDPLTFEIAIKGIWSVYDIGTPIDEKIVQGQIEGGIVQGLGYGSMEVLQAEAGKLRQDSLATYMIPTANDFPRIQIELIHNPGARGPYGAKGVGELPLVGAAPALASAIQNAIGRPVKKIPVTPEDIMELMRDGN